MASLLIAISAFYSPLNTPCISQAFSNNPLFLNMFLHSLCHILRTNCNLIALCFSHLFLYTTLPDWSTPMLATFCCSQSQYLLIAVFYLCIQCSSQSLDRTHKLWNGRFPLLIKIVPYPLMMLGLSLHFLFLSQPFWLGAWLWGCFWYLHRDCRGDSLASIIIKVCVVPRQG